MKIDKKVIKELSEYLEEFNLSEIEITEKDIASMIDQRNEARNNKNYALADKIRSELLDKGVLIEDKDGKTTWKIK